MSSLSGKDWWHANQARFPNSRDLDDLNPTFRDGVVRFIRLLREGGAAVVVSSTRRNAARAYLMHYSWCIWREELPAADVPPHKAVDIIWDHGNEEASRKAAREMVSLFNIAFKPSLTSNHIRGLAVDMRISWKGDLFLGPLPDGSFCGVAAGPRNGAKNHDLHGIGEMFGVKKLLKDPPHWSSNGR